MRKILFLAAALAILQYASNSYAFSNKGENCAKCHTLKKEEAAALLKDIVPNVKILSIKLTPLKSMWQIDIESGNKKGSLYLDITKKYLISGQIIDIKARKNLTQEAAEELNRIDVSKVPLGDAIVMGDKNAKKRVIVFTDPDCPFCAKLHPELKEVIAERKDVVFFVKMFPLPIHKEAADKAKAIVCEKSLALLDAAFEKKPVAKAKCKTSAVDDNITLGKKLGITGTPTLVMPDGRVISGFRDANALKASIDKK
jgi:thiol:disulfide interchange protein DsbC